MLEALDISLLTGAQVSTNAREGSSGNGGTIDISADEVHAKGGYISASTFGWGDAGSILIEGNNISFSDGAQIAAGAREGSSANGGSIAINAAGSFTIGGKSSEGYSSGLFTDTDLGRGGYIVVTASSLSLTEGGYILASTKGDGEAGNISISADNFSAKGQVRIDFLVPTLCVGTHFGRSASVTKRL